MSRVNQLQNWLVCLKEIEQEFSGTNVNINTAIKSFESQLKELIK